MELLYPWSWLTQVWLIANWGWPSMAIILLSCYFEVGWNNFQQKKLPITIIVFRFLISTWFSILDFFYLIWIIHWFLKPCGSFFEIKFIQNMPIYQYLFCFCQGRFKILKKCKIQIFPSSFQLSEFCGQARH